MPWFCMRVRPIVLIFFNIFKHLRGSKSQSRHSACLKVRIIFLKNTEKASIFVFFCISLILEKRVLFKKKVSGLQKKGIFSGIFTERGLFSGAPSQCFF